MELRHLRYFEAVAEAGSLTAAATQLHMSQPPLSVAIGKLEAELGVQLFLRTSRGVEPTSAGRYLLDAASRVLGDVDDVVASVRRFGSGATGSLALAAVPALMWHRVPDLLRAFSVDAPEVEVRLVDPPPWTAIDMLHQRAVDAAAILVAEHDRFIDLHTQGLDVIDWGEIPLVAVLPPREDTTLPLPLEAFTGSEVVMPRRTAAVPSLPEAIDAAFQQHNVVPARVRTMETIQTSLPLIEAGLAWGIMPDADRRSLSRFDVTVRTLEPSPDPLRALVLTRADTTGNPARDRLLRHITGNGGSGDNLEQRASRRGADRGR